MKTIFTAVVCFIFALLCGWITMFALVDGDIITGAVFGLVTVWWCWKSAGFIHLAIEEAE